MPEPIKYNLSGAVLNDSTIDFYVLLDSPSTANADELRGKIQALYAEAQANRDHRNLTKRREYQTLLELLPAARAALLETSKRERYDNYLIAARAGTPPVDFETFMNDLMGFSDDMEEKTGLLGVQDKQERTPSRTKSNTNQNQKTTPTPVVRPEPLPEPVPSGGINPMAIGGAVGGLVIGAGIGFAVGHGKPVPIILLAIILGAIGFVALNRKPKNAIKS